MKTIDATNKSLGRVATEVAMALMGKDNPKYQPNAICGSDVTVINASLLNITEKKKSTTVFDRFTGYPSGRKMLTLGETLAKKGFDEVVRHAVSGMIPTTRLKKEMLSKLTVTE